MVKHTQTIRHQFAYELFEYVSQFCGVGAERVKRPFLYKLLLTSCFYMLLHKSFVLPKVESTPAQIQYRLFFMGSLRGSYILTFSAFLFLSLKVVYFEQSNRLYLSSIQIPTYQNLSSD